MTQRVELEGTSTWTYDTAANGKGKLASTTGPTNSYARSYVYDSLGRPAIVGTSINTVLYNMSVGYDTGTGRVTNVQFPSTVTGFGNFAFYNNYDAKGFLTAVSSLANNGGTKFWQLDANGIDAEGRVLSETMGNSTQTKRTYNPISDLLSDINTTGPTSTTVQSSHYSYFSGVPNLNSRSSTVVGYNYTETFAYDALNRVLSANITGGASKAFAYDSLGNITSKTGVGSYTYGTATVRPHAVASISGTVNGVVNPTYSYDANGNQTIGAGRTLGYTSFNVPKSVTMATISQSYAYDAEHQRIVMTEGSANTTTYINPRWDAGTHFEKEKKGNIDEYKHYIYAGGRPVALYVVKRDNGTGINSTYTRYLHTDHLGSVDTITSETGAVLERLGYDTWGKRRNANGSDSATQLTSTVDHHGYTGHEMNDSIGLINMNGRWYDPTLGRMMQADATIQSPQNLQNYNRFSYVMNNPLSMTDPGGFNWLSKSWKKAWKSKAMHVFRMYQVASAVIAANVAICVGSSGTACASSLYATAKGIEAYDMGVRDPGQMALIYGGNYLQAYSILTPVTSAGASLVNGSYMDAARTLANYYMRQKTNEAVQRYADAQGFSPWALNIALMSASLLAPSRMTTLSWDAVKISGIATRGFAYLPFDAIDVVLGYQGLPTGTFWDYVANGNGLPIIAHSLGTLDASNLVAWGFASNAVLYSVPFGYASPGGTSVTINATDTVNGYGMGLILNPTANVIAQPATFDNSLGHGLCAAYGVCI